jgi:hypothetical protein
MSKKTLIEANVFAKLLAYFFDKKAKGQESDLENKLKDWGNNPEYDRAYDAWKTAGDKLLLSTRALLVKHGKDTSEIDALIKKYAK